MLADALPPEGLPVEPSPVGIARRRLLFGRVSWRDRSGEADDPHRALAGASLDRGACGYDKTFDRNTRGLILRIIVVALLAVLFWHTVVAAGRL
jgi:hypothetical protein